jgi:hypothetical protein
MAVRLDRNYPNVYFGKPGALVTLPYPRGDMDRSYDRLTFDFVTGSGQHMVSSMVGGSRPYAINWNALHVDSYAKVEQFWTGMNGPGPFVFIDPSATNLLPPNVASATGLMRNASQWTVVNAEGAASSNSSSTYIHRTGGTRSLRWLWATAAAAFPVLEIPPLYRSWYGHPVAPGLPYIFSSWVRADGVVDTSITVAMKLEWKDSTGANIGSQVNGGDIAVSGWQQLSVTSTAPSNAAYLRVFWVATGSTITTGGSLYIDEPMLEQDSVINTWAPGTGIRPVEIVGLNEPVPFASRFRKSLTLSLRELTA